jgi:hypothetical protein
MVACENGHTTIVQNLLQNKANINAQDHNGWTPLYYACSEGHIEILDILIDANADLNLISNTDTKCSPLMIAALNDHAEIVKKLLEKKSDIDYRDTNGETALYQASYSGRNEIVDILLKANGNLNIYTCKH